MNNVLLNNAFISGEGRNGATPAATETDISEAYARSPAVTRRTVRSFDIFDTLIARNCIEPHVIFARVEALTQIAGFAADRSAAEQRVSGRAYTLDDIYDELMKVRSWTQDERDHAQAAEIFIELEAVIPVAENMAQVRDGDVAVSDMYLPESVIRMLLKKAGLDKEIGMVVSAHGKRSGEIWPHLLANYHIEQHVGDNKIADIESPERHGIPSRHTTVSSPDLVEAWLINNGMRDLAQIVRQARLANWNDDPVLRQLEMIQIQYNFPILVLSSILLARFVAANNIGSVLFCSRDCKLWQDLFGPLRKQLGVETNDLYFYTSRQARLKSSPDYRRYAAGMLQGNSVLVDVCGTGWSLSHLQRNLGTHAPLFLIDHLPKMDEYEKLRPTPDGIPVHAVVAGAAPRGANEYLEMANYADHPQVVDVSYIHNAAHPVFAPERRSQATLRMVRAQRAAFRKAVALCEAEGLSATLNMPEGNLRATALELYKSLHTQQSLWTVYGSMHVEEEAEQMQLLKRFV
jgi:hypothetical protein